MTCLRVEAPVARLYRNFHGSLRNLLAGGPSSRKKHLANFSKILSLRCLATCLGDLFAVQLSREKRMFCASRTVFKTFQFSFKHFLLFIVLSISLSHKLTVFHSQKSSIFFIISSTNIKKRYGFFTFHKVFHVYRLDFLIFRVFLSFEKYDVRIWVGRIFVKFVEWFLLIVII